MVLRLPTAVVLAISISQTSALQHGHSTMVPRRLSVGTWNVLSKSKSTESASGFPGIDKAALDAHNKPGWVRKEVRALFQHYALDLLFLQEIDEPMLYDLQFLRQKVMPITGDSMKFKDDGKKYKADKKKGTLSVAEMLKQSKMNEPKNKKPANDFPFVVWDTKKVESVSCYHSWDDPKYYDEEKEENKAYDMGKIGLCTVKPTGTKMKFNILAMHADGDKGFTVAQAEEIMKKKKPNEIIHIVIGDMNLKDRELVETAVKPFEQDARLVVPETKYDTVYRRVHTFRKIIQAFENGKLVNDESALAIECEEKEGEAETCTLSEALQAIKKIYDGHKPGDSKVEQGFYSMKDEKTKRYRDIWDGLGLNLKINWEAAIKKIENKKSIIKIEPFQNWRFGKKELLGSSFTKAMKLRDDLVLDMPIKKAEEQGLIKDEIKREDWFAFDEGTFRFTGEIVDREEDIKDDALDKKPLPSWDQPSDHLPVIVHLEYEDVENQKITARSKDKAPPVSRIVRSMLRFAKKAATTLKHTTLSRGKGE